VDLERCHPDWLLPHIQPYEFEALLFSDTSHFAREQPEWEQLAEELAATGAGPPVRNTSMTAPTPIRRLGWSDLPATTRFATVRLSSTS